MWLMWSPNYLRLAALKGTRGPTWSTVIRCTDHEHIGSESRALWLCSCTALAWRWNKAQTGSRFPQQSAAIFTHLIPLTKMTLEDSGPCSAASHQHQLLKMCPCLLRGWLHQHPSDHQHWLHRSDHLSQKSQWTHLPCVKEERQVVNDFPWAR